MNTWSDVGGTRGYDSPSAKSAPLSSRTVSSELEVIEEDMESAGVDVGVAPWARARASASETADK